MTTQERVAIKSSQHDDSYLKYKIKAELLGKLKSTGVDIFVVKGKRVGELQDTTLKKMISITNIIRMERVKVWMGDSKGLLQILRKRVFTETSKDVCNYYTLRGRGDIHGKTII